MKRTIPLFLILGALLAVASCREKDKAPGPPMIFTPELLVSFAGKSWTEVEPLVNNKQDYNYYPENQPLVTASVTLTGTDEGTPDLRYKLLFNINRENKVSMVLAQCLDSLRLSQGNQVFLRHYHKVFAPMQSVTFQEASFALDINQKVPVADLVRELNAGTAPLPILLQRNTQLNVQAMYTLWSNNKGKFYWTVYAF